MAQQARKGAIRYLFPPKTPEHLKEDLPRVAQLYRNGLPNGIWNLVNSMSHRPAISGQRAPTESKRSPNLDDRIAAANKDLTAILGREKVAEPQNHTTFIMESRGQHVPTGMLARDLRNQFWHRLYKGSRDAQQALYAPKKKEDAAEE